MAPSIDRFAPISRPESLSQQAYTSIRGAIRSGVLVHERFYSEGELAKSMQISRTPVREALIELNREGLVEVVPQRGFRLRALDESDRQEVFELRAVLETYIVGRIAAQATPADVAKLRALLHRQFDHIEDPVTFLEIDEEFHLLMPQLVGLTLTYQMLFVLRGAMSLMAAHALQNPERALAVVEEHTAVLDAIEAGSAENAIAAMKRHLHETSVAVKNSEAK